MTREEAVDKCNELYAKVEEFLKSVDELREEARELFRLAEYLPADVKDIDPIKEDEDDVSELYPGKIS